MLMRTSEPFESETPLLDFLEQANDYSLLEFMDTLIRTRPPTASLEKRLKRYNR